VTLKQWRLWMWIAFAVLCVGGIGAIAASSIWIARDPTAEGFYVGSAGTLALVLGALFGKFAMVGPVPKKLQEAGP
jgi:uncharacterized membrane protein